MTAAERSQQADRTGRRAFALVLAIGLVGIGLGCGRTAPPAPPPPSIKIAAASDLQRALPILISRFKLDTGTDVVTTFGASGTLVEQIKAGAPYDLFLSANLGFVEGLAKDGTVVPESVRPYARGQLALVVPVGSSKVKSVADLSLPEVKTIALANPTFAPYGQAAKQTLEHFKLWDKLEAKRVLASNVRETLQFVESGNADAGFVGTAIVQGTKTLRVIPVDPDAYAPIIQGLGVVARSSNRADADRFAQFLLSEAGQGILRDLGFMTVAPKAP